MTFTPDIFVDPNYQNQGIGKRLMMEVIKEYGHTNIFLGSQKENEIFFEKIGFEKSIQSYSKRFRENPYFN